MSLMQTCRMSVTVWNLNRLAGISCIYFSLFIFDYNFVTIALAVLCKFSWKLIVCSSVMVWHDLAIQDFILVPFSLAAEALGSQPN